MKSVHPANRPLPPPTTPQYHPNFIPGSAMHLPSPHPATNAHLSRASSANVMHPSPRGSTTHLSRTHSANAVHLTPVGSMTHLASPVYASTPYHNAPPHPQPPLMDPYQHQYVPERPSQFFPPIDDDMRSVVSRQSYQSRRSHCPPGPMNGPVPHQRTRHVRTPSNGKYSNHGSDRYATSV